MATKGATMRQTAQNETVGPKMHSALRCVAKRGPYQSKNQLATTVGPNGSHDYGYRIVDRCLRKDLLKVHGGHKEANPHGIGAVVLTDKGARYLNQHTDLALDPSEYVDANTYRYELRE